jgi:hypothetical protein
LGFARLGDYAGERLGISARVLQSAAHLAARLTELPAIAAAFAHGELSWTQVRVLADVAESVDDAQWLERARTQTVEQLVALVEEVQHGAGGPAPTDDDLLDGEPSTRLRLACPGRVRVLWRHTLELARRAAGAPLPTWGAAELIAAEGIAGRPAGMSVGDRVLRAWLRLTRRGARRSAGEVDAGRDALGPGATVAAPRTDGARAESAGTPDAIAVEAPAAEIDFTGPLTVVALFRDAMEAFERVGEPRWVAVERLLNSVIAEWEAQPRHLDPVFARDGWRCQVPACSARRELQDHHVAFRSRGGSNARNNRIAICAAHHLHGVHAGVIRASGTAPHAVRWQLGVRAGAPALLTFLGDRLCGAGDDAVVARRGSMTG